MDYHSMKRRELQDLCKKHDIPANSANSVLAYKLSELLNKKQKPTSRQRTCMKSAVETTDEMEPTASRREAKNVRFSPTNDLVEYELRSGKKEKDTVTETKNKRKSVAKKVAKPVVDNINTVELTNDGVQIPVRATRSRVQGKDDAISINEKKQGRRAVKDAKKETDAVKEVEVNLGKITRSKVHTLGKGGSIQLDENKQNKRGVKDVEKAGESDEGTVVGRVRVTRSKAQTLMEDSISPNLNPQVKKKSGRRVVNDVENVEPSKEIMDAPVRVTRSRGQTKVSDLSNNLSNVASENNQELHRRKSSRTSGVEIATKDGSERLGHGKRKKRSEESSTAEVSESQHHADKESRQSRRNRAKVEDSTVLNPSVRKVEMVVEKKVTRSKALLARKSSEGNNKNRAKKKTEVQRKSKIVQHAGRKNVNRRKSVMQHENTEVVESPNVGTHKVSAKRKSKEQPGNLSMHDEGLEDEENITKSGKDASENETKAVGSVSGSHRSKKKRGNPVIEDQIIETVYVSPVDESPRRSTRSKSEGKAVSYPRQHSVAKKQQESSVNTPAIIKDTSSKRRANSSESKPSDSEGHAPVSKSENFELDQKVTEIEGTPVIKESIRRVTRSGAIRSERNTAVNTTPGRYTRSGIKHRENAGSKLFETVDEEKQQSQSPEVTGVVAHPNVTNSKVIKNSNFRKKEKTPHTVQKTVHADIIKISKEAEDQILERSDDLSVSESVRLPTNITEENTTSMSEAAIVIENESFESAENASGSAPGEVMEVEGADLEKSTVQFTCSAAENETAENLLSGKQRSSVGLPNFEDETPSGTSFSDIKRTPFPMAEVSETMPDVQNQNQEAYVKSATFSEAQVQVAVNIENPDVKSARPDAYGKELESPRSGSISKRLQTDVMVEEPSVSALNVDIAPGVTNKGNNGDADNNCDSISYEASPAACHVSFGQSYDRSKSKEMEDLVEPSIIEGGEQFIEDDGSYAQIEKEQDMLTVNDSLQNPSAGKHEIADDDAPNDDGETANDDDAQNADDDAHDEISQKQLMDESVSEDNGVHGGIDAEANGDDSLEQSTGDDVVAMDENDIKVATQDSLAEQSELSIGKNTIYATDNGGDNGKEIKSEVMPLPSIGNDVFQMPILNKSDGEDGTVKGCESDLMPSTAGNILEDSVELSSGDGDGGDEGDGDGGDEGVDANKEHESNSKPSTDIVVDFNMSMELEPISEPSTTNGIEGKCDNATDALNSYLEPSNGDDLEVEGDSINVPKELEPGLEPSNTLEVPDDKTDGQDGESEQEQLTSNDSPAMDEQNVGDDEPELSNGDDLEVEGDSINVPKELEPGLEPSNTLEVPDDKTDGQDGESEQEQLTSNDSPAMDEHNVGDDEPELVQNENMPVEVEVIIGSSDKKAEPVLNAAVDEVPCDIVDSSTQEETPQTPATNENDITDPIVDINKDDVFKTSGGIDELENATGVIDTGKDIDFCGSEQKSKESESTDNEQRAEEAETVPENDHLLGDREEQTVATADHLTEQTVATIDHSMDTNDFMKECSNHGVDEENTKTLENPTREENSPITYTEEKPAVDDLGGSDQFAEDISVHESPIREENLPITYKKEEFSDPPTLLKDDGINKQEETQQASTSVDWGNHICEVDEYQKPVSASESDAVLAESLPITSKKEEFLDLPTFSKDDDINKQEETQQTSTSVDWGNHISEIDEYQKPLSATENESDGVLAEIMKEDRVTDLQTSGRASSSMEKSSSPAAAEFVNLVTDLEKASTNEADANADANVPEDFFNWSDADPSLKALFTTPTTNRTSNVKHDQEDAVRFTFPDDGRSCDDIGIRGSGAHDFDGQWESQPFDDKTQNTATQSNEMYGVSNYFGDEGDGSSEKKKEDKP